MVGRFLLAAAVVVAIVASADAGPLRHRRAHVQSYFHQSSQSYSVQPCGPCGTPGPVQTFTQADSTRIEYGPPGNPAHNGDGLDALAEVNAKRAARGLRSLLPDPGLTQAARACAAFRAEHGLFGHISGGAGDFQFLPPGARADSAGCAAYPDSFGWMSCCVYEQATYGGAAWVRGADGKRYMHLFIRR